jgi:Trypsin-like peptidase domain
MKKTIHLNDLFFVVLLLFIFLFSTHSFAENRELTVKYEDLMLILAAEAGDSNAQYELAKKYILGESVKQNRHLAEKWLIHSILNDPKNKKSIELIEKEFNWHCVDGDFCKSIINNASIIHDKNLSWYWEIGLDKFEMDKKVMRVTLKNYDVMNCNNRTLGHKTLQALDSDLNPKENFTYADNKIEFKPLEPSAYSDKLFNYVCGQTNVDKKAEDVHEVSFGTGWPTQHGYVITNQHVINGKKKITVVSTSGKKFSATVLIEDKINDLAVLQVEHPDKLPPALPIANASARTGSKVFTIGYPHPDVMGEKPKLTEGIVNAISGYMDDPRILQISVPVQAGNSGGPLLNMNGEVVGIVTAKLSAVKMFNWTGDLPQNVNYAIKASYITALLKSVKEQSTVTKMLPVKRADLESLSSRIQNSVFLIIAE